MVANHFLVVMVLAFVFGTEIDASVLLLVVAPSVFSRVMNASVLGVVYPPLLLDGGSFILCNGGGCPFLV